MVIKDYENYNIIQIEIPAIIPHLLCDFEYDVIGF